MGLGVNSLAFSEKGQWYGMVVTLVTILVLIVMCIFVHYEALRLISGTMRELRGPPRARLLIVLGGVLFTHLLEILLFAAAFWVLENTGGGTFEGVFNDQSFVDFFYLSASGYTTLGTGDVYVEGPMRMLWASEALVGLVLIGWSTSFTYLAMRDFWELH